jgi:nucleotidyltransferase substrate binding protein (TIGR01987 family)
MSLQTEHLARCVQTLEASLKFYKEAEAGSMLSEVYRNAVVKGFELTLETAGKLLRRALKSYGPSPRTVDAWSYKDVFRNAAKYGLVEPESVERWFTYRENRNDTAHDYGIAFAEETLALLPGFIADARVLETTLHEKPGDAEA